MTSNKIIDISLANSVTAYRSPEVEFEYKTAISDLLRENSFKLDNVLGPYKVSLSTSDNRVVFMISSIESSDLSQRFSLPMSPFKRLIKDYFMICESYYNAIKNCNPSQIETIDMAKRSLHNESADLMKNLLFPQIEIDFDTARRLFTLVCVLHVE